MTREGSGTALVLKTTPTAAMSSVAAKKSCNEDQVLPVTALL